MPQKTIKEQYADIKEGKPIGLMLADEEREESQLYSKVLIVIIITIMLIKIKS